MISLRNICKTYKTRTGRRVVLADVSHDFPPGVSTGIIGRNGAGKSTMMRIISGSEMPDKGKVFRQGRVSWPLGFSGGFNSTLSGRENMRFTCRLYNEDYKRVCEFVEDFAELGEYMDMPIHTYSSGMKAKLTFGLSMAFEFDYYLIDEATAVGDAAFKRKSQAYFDERRKSTTLLVVSHSMSTIKSLCQKMLVLYEGKLREFPSNEEAEQFYVDVCCGGKIAQKDTQTIRENRRKNTSANA
jgi:capsular polysaccharide transport system ATP-binding protein